MQISIPDKNLSYEEIIPVVPFNGRFDQRLPVGFHTHDPIEALEHGLELARQHLRPSEAGVLNANRRIEPIPFGFIHRGLNVFDKIGEISVSVGSDGWSNWVLYTCEARSAQKNRIRARFSLRNEPGQFEKALAILKSTFNC